MMGRLQFWLQGCKPGNPYRPWFMWRLGNLISDCRFWLWRLRGGSHEPTLEYLDSITDSTLNLTLARNGVGTGIQPSQQRGEASEAVGASEKGEI